MLRTHASAALCQPGRAIPAQPAQAHGAVARRAMLCRQGQRRSLCRHALRMLAQGKHLSSPGIPALDITQLGAARLSLAPGRAQELKAAVARAESAKVDAQRELHEMQIRAAAGAPAGGGAARASEHEAVSNIIDDLEAHGIGAARPRAACGVGFGLAEAAQAAACCHVGAESDVAVGVGEGVRMVQGQCRSGCRRCASTAPVAVERNNGRSRWDSTRAQRFARRSARRALAAAAGWPCGRPRCCRAGGSHRASTALTLCSRPVDVHGRVG